MGTRAIRMLKTARRSPSSVMDMVNKAIPFGVVGRMARREGVPEGRARAQPIQGLGETVEV